MLLCPHELFESEWWGYWLIWINEFFFSICILVYFSISLFDASFYDFWKKLWIFYMFGGFFFNLDMSLLSDFSCDTSFYNIYIFLYLYVELLEPIGCAQYWTFLLSCCASLTQINILYSCSSSSYSSRIFLAPTCP